MKLIIGNHIEHSLLKMSNDDRTFAQRIIWFAEENDILILPCEPDKSFFEYVTSLTGVNLDSLKIFVPPNNMYNNRHFDPNSILDVNFINKLKEYINEIDYIFPMWPSPSIAEFAKMLGLSEKLLGFDFFSQYGVELVNNKAYFRSFAAACNIPISKGAVCHSKAETYTVMNKLLLNCNAIMVKQAHNGAGAGNELIIANSTINTDYVGAEYIYNLKESGNSITDYLEKRWLWASVNESRPVIIEEFIENAKTIYAEFFADQISVYNTGSGRLGYIKQRLTQEIAPLRNLSENTKTKLLSYGEKLSLFYHNLGYRGYLSADAIVDENNNLVFTEMNSRVGGSLHIYDSIANKLVRVFDTPERTVSQYHSPSSWKKTSFKQFFDFLKENNIDYDPVHRKGIILSFPIIEELGGYISFSIVYETLEEEQFYYRFLEKKFYLDKPLN